jgi:hypothetical protein
VHVRGDAGDAFDREVEIPHRFADAPQERQVETADAPIDVEEDPALARRRSHLRNRIDGSVREVGRAALWKAGWAEIGTTISGSTTSGRWTRAWSRAALMARMMLSVPPLVMLPTT